MRNPVIHEYQRKYVAAKVDEKIKASAQFSDQDIIKQWKQEKSNNYKHD